MDNQYVHAGDTLVVLDDRDYKIRLHQALAALTSAEADRGCLAGRRSNEARSSIATAQANVEQAKVAVWKANEDYDRYKNLYNDHAITKAQFDEAKSGQGIRRGGASRSRRARYRRRPGGSM